MMKEVNCKDNTLTAKCREVQLAWDEKETEKLASRTIYFYRSYFEMRFKVLFDGIRGPNFRKIKRCEPKLKELVEHEKDHKRAWEILESIENMISPLEVSNPGRTDLRLTDYFDVEHNVCYSTKLMYCSKGVVISRTRPSEASTEDAAAATTTHDRAAVMSPQSKTIRKVSTSGTCPGSEGMIPTGSSMEHRKRKLDESHDRSEQFDLRMKIPRQTRSGEIRGTVDYRGGPFTDQTPPPPDVSGFRGSGFRKTESRYPYGSDRGSGSRDGRSSSDERSWSRDDRHVNNWRSRDGGRSYRDDHYDERSSLDDRRDRQTRDNIRSRDNRQSRDSRQSRYRSRSRENRRSREYKSSRDKYSYRHAAR